MKSGMPKGGDALRDPVNKDVRPPYMFTELAPQPVQRARKL